MKLRLGKRRYVFECGNLTGIWGAALTIIISEEALLFSVSRTRKNFSASMVVTSGGCLFIFVEVDCWKVSR